MAREPTGDARPCDDEWIRHDVRLPDGRAAQRVDDLRASTWTSRSSVFLQERREWGGWCVLLHARLVFLVVRYALQLVRSRPSCLQFPASYMITRTVLSRTCSLVSGYACLLPQIIASFRVPPQSSPPLLPTPYPSSPLVHSRRLGGCIQTHVVSTIIVPSAPPPPSP